MKLYVLVFTTLCFLYSVAGYSQISVDTFPNYKITNHPYRKTPFVKSLLIPSAALLYGVISLNRGALNNFNHTVQKNVMAGSGHYTNLDDYLQYTPAIAGHVLSIAGVKGKHKLFDRLMIDGIAAVGTTAAVLFFKSICSETRPDGSDDRSFPSNHAATAFCAAELLREEYREVSPWYGIAGYTVAAATGYLRLYNNKHWFGDVIAGAAIGIASARIANKLFPLAKRIVFGKPKTRLIIPG